MVCKSIKDVSDHTLISPAIVFSSGYCLPEIGATGAEPYSMEFFDMLRSEAESEPQRTFYLLVRPQAFHEGLSRARAAGLHGMPGNLFVGLKALSDDSYYDVAEALSWLLATSRIRRFLLLDGVPNELALDDLRPCGNNLPYHGDYNALDGNVYHAGSYSYRDSMNAYMARTGKLDLVIMDRSDRFSEDVTLLEQVAETCISYRCPVQLTERFRSALDADASARSYPFEEAATVKTGLPECEPLSWHPVNL